MSESKPVRIDQWLWAVRLFKTRAAAKDGCASGRVKVNGAAAKPATRVTAGDTVNVRRRGLTGTYEVVQPINKRVGAAKASECLVDHTPPEQRRPPSPTRTLDEPAVDAAPAARRERGSGRPTKRDRRQTDRLRGH